MDLAVRRKERSLAGTLEASMARCRSNMGQRHPPAADDRYPASARVFARQVGIAMPDASRCGVSRPCPRPSHKDFPWGQSLPRGGLTLS